MQTSQKSLTSQSTRASNASRSQGRWLNWLVTAVGGWLIWYLSGPAVAEMGRSLYESFYSAWWGTPGYFNPAYWFSYLPQRGHLYKFLFDYTEYIAPLVLAYPLHKLPDWIRWCFRRGVDRAEERIEALTGQQIPDAIMDGLHSAVDALGPPTESPLPTPPSVAADPDPLFTQAPPAGRSSSRRPRALPNVPVPAAAEAEVSSEWSSDSAGQRKGGKKRR